MPCCRFHNTRRDQLLWIDCDCKMHVSCSRALDMQGKRPPEWGCVRGPSNFLVKKSGRRLSSLLLSRSPIGSRDLNLQLLSLITPDQGNIASQTLNRLIDRLIDAEPPKAWHFLSFWHFRECNWGWASCCRSGHIIQGLRCDLGVPFSSHGGVQLRLGCLVDSPSNEGIFRRLGDGTG